MTYEFEGKTEKEAIELAANELNLERDQFDVEILETQKTSLFKKGYVKIRVHTLGESKKPSDSNKKSSDTVAVKSDDATPLREIEEKVMEFVKNVVEKMGYDVKVFTSYVEHTDIKASGSNHNEIKMGLRLESSNSSILIGRKGKNLDALQLLANIYVGRLGHEEIRIILDTENYRIRREETLVRLAYNTADKVRMSKKSILLEPMNPFERRLIHTTLNDISDVETKSEGDGLYKQVRVLYKGLR